MENLSGLRSKIDDSLRNTSAYADIRKHIQDHAASASLTNGQSERTALEVLLSRSVPVVATTPSRAPPEHFEFSSSSLQFTRRVSGLQLRVNLRGGRNFQGGLVDHNTGSVRWALRCSILFRGQRAVGQPVEVAPGETAPNLQGSFLFEVAADRELQGGIPALASSPDLVNVCITKEVVGCGEVGLDFPPEGVSGVYGQESTDATLSGLSRILVATAAIDWRQALTSQGGARGSQSLAVALRPAGDDQQMEGSSGLLVVGLDLLTPASAQPLPSHAPPPPSLPLAARLLSELGDDGGRAAAAGLVGREAAEEARMAQDAARTLFLHARSWWNALVREQQLAALSAAVAPASTRQPLAPLPPPSSGSKQPVKLFAVDESDGQRKLVCLFLGPLRAGRGLLPSPRHALRFVSLLPLERRKGSCLVGGARAEREKWPSHFMLLSRRAGDAEAQALLLCSLLLGFGLDAYVALGTRFVSAAPAPPPSHEAAAAEGRGPSLNKQQGGQQQQQQQAVPAAEVEHAWVVTFGAAPLETTPPPPPSSRTGDSIGGSSAQRGGQGVNPSARTPPVTGWDPVSGAREPYAAFVRKLSLRSCHTLFNADHVYANVGPQSPPAANAAAPGGGVARVPALLNSSLDLSDDRCWRRFPPAAHPAAPLATNDVAGASSEASVALARLPRVNAGFALLPPFAPGTSIAGGLGLNSGWGSGGGGSGLGSSYGTGQVHLLEEALESDLRRRIASWRGQQLSPRLHTHWDEELCYLLEPALSAYEAERCLGVSYGNDDFTESIRRAVPEGFQFKGFPACFGHANANEIWRSLAALAPSHRSTRGVALDLLGSRGSEVHLAMRVKVIPFPDGVCATWIMLAAKLRP